MSAFSVSFILLLAIRLVYIFSFPLNFGGDGSIYYTMILNQQSSLLMAGGYPFLMMWPYRLLRKGLPNDPAWTPWWQTSTIRKELLETGILGNFSWSDFFQDHGFILFQHAIMIAALWCGYRLVQKYFGNKIALVFLWIYGLSPLGLELPSSVRPEWLQGALLVFWLYWADKAKGRQHWYDDVGLGIVAALSFLVKFNSLPIFTLFFVAYWWLKRGQGAGKRMAGAIVGALSCIGLFIASYHLPTTGTTKLSLNTWILANKYFHFLPGNSLTPDIGIHTKRLLILHRDLPKKDEKAALAAEYFWHLDAAKSARADVREPLLWTMHGSDESLSQDLTQKGIPLLREHDTTLRVAYYFGLPEYSLLHKEIYKEAIKRYPLFFCLDTLQAFFKSFSMRESSFIFRPEWSELRQGRQGKSHYGYVQFLWPSDRFVCYHENTAWLPGTWLFTKLNQFWPPTWSLWLFAFVSFALALKGKVEQSRRPWILFIFGSFAMFVLFSCSTFTAFRLKEFELIRAPVSMLAAVGIVQSIVLVRQWGRTVLFRRKLNYGS